MLRLIETAAVSFFTWPLAFASLEAAPANLVPVMVTSAAEDQMARRLASAVVKEFKRDPRFVSAMPGSPGAVNVSLPARVGFERRLDWTKIMYQARLSSAGGRSRVIAGDCWNWNLKVCAKQIADEAALAGSN